MTTPVKHDVSGGILFALIFALFVGLWVLPLFVWVLLLAALLGLLVACRGRITKVTDSSVRPWRKDRS